MANNYNVLDAPTHAPMHGALDNWYWGPMPEVPIGQTIVKDDNTPVPGNPAIANWELAHNGTESYILHLVGASGMSGSAALIGLGVSYGGSGIFINNYKSGVGLNITNRDTTDAALSHGLRVTNNSTIAPGAWFGTGVLGTKPVAVFTAHSDPPAAYKLVQWLTSRSTASDTEMGYVDADAESFVWSGPLVHGTAALATNATDGFFYLRTTAGTPTGTPTARTGTVPCLIDTTGSKLWAYIGGAWKSTTLA